MNDNGSAAGPQCGDVDEDQSAPSDPTDDRNPQEQDEPGSGSGSAGSKPSGQMPASHDPCGTGEVMDADERRDDATGQSGESPVDTPAEEQAWDEAMHQAASLARAQGNAPGARRRDDPASASEHPRLAVAVAPLHDRCRPPRLFLERSQPALHRQRPLSALDALAGYRRHRHHHRHLRLAAGRDAARFWAEVREIAAELQPESIYVLQVDAVLQDVAQYPTGELPDRISIKGRGGTDFQPGFAWLHEQGVRPGCCLYLTDMECDSYPEAEPGYPVVWVNWGAAGGPNREPWGERIDIGPA